MTKADLVSKIYEQFAPTKKEASDIVESIFDIMKSALSDGDDVKISGFGKFVIREKSSRKGRNPQTGEEMIISSRRVLTFKPSQVLRGKVNGD